MIRSRGLSKSFGAVKALEDVSIDVPASGKLAVVGANGSGKSTLLKLCAGLVRPSSGEIVINAKPPRQSRSSFGYLGHDSYLYPYLSVRENIEMYAGLFGVEPSTGLEIAGELGLRRRIDLPVGNLSRGEVQKAALSRCMLHQPKLLLLDEPFTGLDEDSIRVLETRLETSNATIVLATHQMTEGLSAWPRLKLEEGRAG